MGDEFDLGTGIFVTLFDDASPANLFTGRTADQIDCQSSMLMGSINAAIALGRHAVTSDSALVMNGLLAELWSTPHSRRHLEAALRNGWLRASSRGTSIFERYEHWTKDGARNPNRQHQENYVNWLRQAGTLDTVTLPMGSTGTQFEDRFWAHTVSVLLDQCSRAVFSVEEVRSFIGELLQIQDQASQASAKHATLSRVMLRLNRSTEGDARRKYPNVAPFVLTDTDAIYNDSFAATLGLPSLVAPNAVPTMPLLRGGVGIEVTQYPASFAFPSEDRLAGLGAFAPEQVAKAAKAAGLVDAREPINHILAGVGTVEDHRAASGYIERLAAQLAIVREDAVPILPASTATHWRHFVPEIADKALAAMEASPTKDHFQALTSALAVVGTFAAAGMFAFLSVPAGVAGAVVTWQAKLNARLVKDSIKSAKDLNAALRIQEHWEADVADCRASLLGIAEALRNEVRPVFTLAEQ